MESFIGILFMVLIIIGFCCALVTQGYAKEVNTYIDKELGNE